MYWTKDPVEAPDFSDWKVSLVHPGSDGDQEDETATTDKQVVTYHVHRVFLGFRSHYFHRLFSSSSDSSLSFSEAKNCHNEIVLPRTLSDEAFRWTIDAFEIFLDQSYQKELVPATGIRLQILVALWYLVDYLQLTDEFDLEGQSKGVMIRQWMWNTLNAAELERGPGDLYHAVKEFRAAGFNLEKARSMIAKFCVREGPSSIAPHTGIRIAEEADVPLWLDIVSFLSRETNDYDATAWSLNIAYFLEKDDVSYGVFQQLTSKSILIEVHPKAALVFMDLDHDLKASSNVGDTTRSNSSACETDYDLPANSNMGDNCNNEGTWKNESVTDFQEHWVDALVNAELRKPEKEELRDLVIPVISKYPPLVSLYLNRTLNCFDIEIDTLREQSSNEIHKLRDENEKLRKEGCELQKKNRTLRRKKMSLKETEWKRYNSYVRFHCSDSDSEVDTPTINSGL